MLRFSPRGPSTSRVLALFLGFVLSGVPLTSRATDLGIKVEPGLALPLTQQQSQRFDLGGGVPVKLLYGLGRYADATVSISFLGLPRSSDSLSSRSGTGWGYGGGLRVKGPHDSRALGGLSPWIDADLLYVRTGALDRLGFAAGAGVAFPMGEARRVWVGPFVRYQQIVGRDGVGVDSRDARILLAGLSFELGTSPMHPAVEQKPTAVVEPVVEPAVAPVVAPVVAAVAPEVAAEVLDRDGDGTADKDDSCPDVAGPSSNRGCPVDEKVDVKLALKDRIQFGLNSPRIEQASHPVLDEAVRALQDNKGFRVRVEGHASSEGGEEHNQELSEDRARSVLDYLVTHGVDRQRLVSKGFSSSRPVESNTTASGREANRRVEFIVLEKGNS